MNASTKNTRNLGLSLPPVKRMRGLFKLLALLTLVQVVLSSTSHSLGRAAVSGLGTSYSAPAATRTTRPDTGTLTYEQFTAFVAKNLNAYWQKQFESSGYRAYYARPTLRIVYRFRTIPTPCEDEAGRKVTAALSTGPFYCPANKTIYIPENVFGAITDYSQQRHGDFAIAYVIAHEWGHHVQTLLRTPDKGGATSELQADCLAGIWTNSLESSGLLEPGDYQEAMNALADVGDDALGNPKPWTHGSSAQRQTWFRTGYYTGNVSLCTP
jgi:hypothetical protein